MNRVSTENGHDAPGNGSSGPQDQLTARLEAILKTILAGRGDTSLASQPIDVNANWSDLGINSVDFLSFLLTVEKEFGVEVQEEELMSGRLMSLAAWAAHLAPLLAGQQIPAA